jgi:arabinan endo-1,5-alpha-L-arabinosidase
MNASARFTFGSLLAAFTWIAPGGAQEVASPDARRVPELRGDITGVHDPVIIRAGGIYYVYSTNADAPGAAIKVRTSPDLATWTFRGHVFDKLPAWTTEKIPGARSFWAPDISLVNGRYRLYYSVSTFGSNRSAIGLATSAALDPTSPDYGWRDEGPVVESTPESDFNAIDPNFVVDAKGRQWLALGSFWNGIKLFELDPATGKVKDPKAKPYALASRRAPAGGPKPVEAPFIVTRPDHYYLFVSYDYCCKGANSTYYMVVGRSKDIRGPYVGKDGSRLLDGEGTIFMRADLEEQQRFRGPGHNGFLHDDDSRDYVVFHAYDKDNKGVPTMRIAAVVWDADGWPQAQR